MQKDIKGFENYQITDDGKVWSKKSKKSEFYIRFGILLENVIKMVIAMQQFLLVVEINT